MVALDKSADRVSKLQAVADAMNLSCIETYVYDARKAVQDGAGKINLCFTIDFRWLFNLLKGNLH